MTSYCRSDILQQSFDFIMSPGGKMVPEDPNPGPLKLKTVADGFILHNVTGIRAHVVSRLDRKGYDITKRRSPFPPNWLVNSLMEHGTSWAACCPYWTNSVCQRFRTLGFPSRSSPDLP